MRQRRKHYFSPNWLEWKVERRDRTVRAYVVEPRSMRPDEHSAIFRAALDVFLPSAPLDYLGPDQSTPNIRDIASPPYFDLLTFPEAFLPVDTFLEVAGQLAQQRPHIGCVHAGLRPAQTGVSTTHLLSTEDLKRMSADLKKLPNLHIPDLKQFDRWLGDKNRQDRFNVGCLFTVDAPGKLRLCLHPKVIKSRSEASPIHERDMVAGNLLSLVTLTPTDPTLLPITIQPLICADVLDLSTDVPDSHPIEAITSARSCFGKVHSDQVDLVSLVTCTENTPSLPDRLEWHRWFRDSFERAAVSDRCRRHRFAAFVMSNFRYCPTSSPETERPAGLSGVFLPLPLWGEPFGASLARTRCIRCHDPREQEVPAERDQWIDADKYQKGQHVLGYIAALDPDLSRQGIATLMGLTIRRLPRDANHWERNPTLSNFLVHRAVWSNSGDQAQIQFQPIAPQGTQ
jgi:hypothetical protein